jgi:epidermal growth factor receptor kinase substrate 8
MASHHQTLYAINSSSNKAYLPLSTSLDEDVRILNHCFDDIEHFVSRLLNVSAYSREIERRQKKYKLRKTQLSTADMGMLSIRAKVPSQQSFYDIFQKFKLSFNLLAHLKAHIHDPNAPELVHFLFTPLKLVINATKDSHTLRGLTKTVWSPLLTREAKELLLNCLTSREQDLWQSCGEAWYISKDEARVLHNLMFFEPYNPIFYDGWSPTIENSDTRSEVSRIAVLAAQQQASLLQAQNSSPNSSRKQRRQHSAQPSNRGW